MLAALLTSNLGIAGMMAEQAIRGLIVSREETRAGETSYR
jgi:hypothetical protein